MAHHNNEEEELRLSDEWLLQYFAEDRCNNPTGGALGSSTPSDLKHQAQKEEEDEEYEEEELARQLARQEHIYNYPDGSVYMGHMCADDGSGETSHKRHGRGTLRTPAFVYGEMKNYTSDEAAENAHLAKWHEYCGMWENDKLHGYGVHVQKSGDGGEILIFEGIWKHGKPVKSVHFKDSDGDYCFDENVFGW